MVHQQLAQEAQRRRDEEIRKQQEEQQRRQQEEQERIQAEREAEFRKMQERLQAKGSSQLQFTDVWEIKIDEVCILASVLMTTTISQFKLRVDHHVFKLEICLLGQRWYIWRRFKYVVLLHP